MFYLQCSARACVSYPQHCSSYPSLYAEIWLSWGVASVRLPCINLPGSFLPCDNFAKWQSCQAALCLVTHICHVTKLPGDNLPVDNFASWQFASCKFCQLTICQLAKWSHGKLVSWQIVNWQSVLWQLCHTVKLLHVASNWQITT